MVKELAPWEICKKTNTHEWKIAGRRPFRINYKEIAFLVSCKRCHMAAFVKGKWVTGPPVVD